MFANIVLVAQCVGCAVIKWTADQKSVIDAPNESLAISASAGAGKTSVMIERIAEIISRGAKFDEILVLTFTEESARDMKNKLMERLSRTGDIHGSGVTPVTLAIGTFHKFCLDLVREYFSVCKVNPSFAILDEGTGESIRNEILDELTDKMLDKCPDVIDAFCGVYGNAGLKKVIKDIAEFLNWQVDGWSEKNAFAGYEKDLSKNIAMKLIIRHFKTAGGYYMSVFLPDSDCYMWAKRLAYVKSYDDIHNIALSFDKLRPMKKDCNEYAAKEELNALLKKIREQYILSLDTIIKNQDRDRELVRQIIVFLKEYLVHYKNTKFQKNFLDFADLEMYATQILSDPEINKRVRAKYKYIFADEYQDTNPVQERILKLLSDEVSGSKCGDSHPLFTVGDLKQSIYAFRGTSAQVFLDRLKSGRVVYLNENFRSGGAILKFVNDIFSKIMREGTAGIDYEATSQFKITDRESKGSSIAEVVCIKEGTAEHEAVYIAGEIVKLLKNGESAQDIAVIARSRTHFDVLKRVFDNSKIPYAMSKDTEAENLYEIAILNNVLIHANDPSYELSKVLLKESFVFDTKPFDVEKYRALALEKDVVTVLSTFIAEYDVVNRLLLTPNGEARVQNIYTFLNKLRGASYASTVKQYVYMLLNGQLDIKIMPSLGWDCVKIMTIHGAKGLEFPTVFLYNAGAAFSIEGKRRQVMLDKDLGMCVYSSSADDNKKRMSIARLGSVIAGEREQIAEEMRLLYVALTRAKERLYVVGCGHEYEQKNLTDFEILNSNSFFDFIRPTDTINADEIPLPKIMGEQYILSAKPDDRLVMKLEERFEKVENYKYKNAADMPQKTTVTSLTKNEEDFADEKLRPSIHEKDRGTEYGTKFHLAMQTGNYFDENTKKCAEIIDEFVRGMKVAREVVIYENAEINGEKILVQGVIDLLAIDKNRAVIIDYKTTQTSEERLLQLYRGQIGMYASSISRATGLLTEAYIYSTKHGKLIRI